MERNFRTSVAILTALTMLIASAGFSFAVEQPGGTAVDRDPAVNRWEGLNTVTGTFEIMSGGKANPIVRGTVYSGKVDCVNVAVSLKRSSGSGWSTIKSWNKDIAVSLNQFTFNETYAVGRNYSYRYSATVKSYKDDVLVDTVSFDSKIVSAWGL